MATLLRSVAFFFPCFLGYSLNLGLLVVMFKDLRIRNSNRPTPIPPSYKAYVFRVETVDSFELKVIIAPSYIIACQRMKDWSIENDISLFWRFVQEDDFEVAYSNNIIPK